jgi:hypothetical protein
MLTGPEEERLHPKGAGAAPTILILANAVSIKGLMRDLFSLD